MQQMAQENAWRPLLKLKLADDEDIARVSAVREGAPQARLIVDANEGWDEAIYLRQAPELARLGVTLIEQPLPAGKDAVLAQLPHPVPLCADESCHDLDSLGAIAGCYEMVNIKLDKTGGLTGGAARAGRGHATWLADHGGLYGQHIVIDGARRGGGAAGEWSISTGRCCWPKIVNRVALRRQRTFSSDPGVMGLVA
jgi:L-alanine-DL-glutamate epimerase-like enolase superfamily enzyme